MKIENFTCMSFIDFVEKIQNKPRYVRIWVLTLFVFVFMFITVSLWVTSLKHSSFKTDLAETKEDIKQGKDKIIGGALSKTNASIAGKEKAPSLIGALKASVSAFFENSAEEVINKQEDREKIEEPNIKKEDLNVIKPARLPMSE
ncbi:MAG: hypothetical protein U9P63_00610 [Patescibacteria group bacterium]|nr:hypothetical protein [Patescibacteria group bacterium]